METERERRQADRIRELLDRVVELEERLAQFETAMADAATPLLDVLTRSESVVLGVLMQREMATKHQLMAALYGLKVTDREAAAEKIVDVFICKLRRKLEPLGIDITTHWGVGVSLSSDAKARVRTIGAGGMAA